MNVIYYAPNTVGRQQIIEQLLDYSSYATELRIKKMSTSMFAIYVRVDDTIHAQVLAHCNNITFEVTE